jgi:hypothetical protein
MRNGSRPLVVMLSVIVTFSLFGCKKKEYVEIPVPETTTTVADASESRKSYVTIEQDLVALRRVLDEHVANAEATTSTVDPLNASEAVTTHREILDAADALESRAQAALNADQIVAEVAGARETFQDYIDHARAMRERYAASPQ